MKENFIILFLIFGLVVNAQFNRYIGVKSGDNPIMSFQSNLNGTITPVITPSTGTLIWDFDNGTSVQETNTPSYANDGSTINIKVYINTASATVTNVNVSSENLIGSLDFSWATLSNLFYAYDNTGLTGITFSASGNTSSYFILRNNGMSSIDFTGFSSIAGLELQNNNFTSLDFSSTTLSGSFFVYSNTSLTSITFSGSGNTSSNVRAYSCNLSTIDFSGYTLSGAFYLYGNSGLTDITFSGSNTSSDFRVYSCNLTDTLDVSSFVFSSTIYGYSNANLTKVLFGGSTNVSSYLIFRSCNLTDTLDLSSFTSITNYEMQSNAITAITWSSTPFNTGASLIRFDNNALTVAEVDEIYSELNTFFTDGGANDPIKNLTVETDAGTNGTPTGGSSNTDIVQLRDTDFPNAGFTFTANIN